MNVTAVGGRESRQESSQVIRPVDAQATCTNHEWMPLHIRASPDLRSHALTYTDPAQAILIDFFT